MNIIRTDKDILSTEDILDYIKRYESDEVPVLDKLWNYYLGKNPTILAKSSTIDNPANKTPISYGRKIITTFTGYAYRPRYIGYKSENEALLKELTATFGDNNEHIKTSLHGRNTAIFGASYELLYIGQNVKTKKPEVKFSVIDPRELILIYDFSLEPVKKAAIRFYSVTGDLWKVAVYYSDHTDYYTMKRVGYTAPDALVFDRTEATYFGEVPIVAYYLGQDRQGIIEPVVGLIDDYDSLVSGGLDEFERFANAYIKLVKMSMTDGDKRNLKRNRIFEQLPDKDAVSFLTKDIPTEYIQFMATLLRDQIHIQSHVPDLGSGSFADGVSGVAVDRLMFDFENVVSSAEAEFDSALYDRIRMILAVYAIQSRAVGDFDEITITHKRNKPSNMKEYAETAQIMKNAGFSDYAIADLMPDEMIPDTESELKRQKEQNDIAIPDIEAVAMPNIREDVVSDESGS